MDGHLDIKYALVSSEDVAEAHEIESKAYPPDEAASLTSFRYRQANASDLFLGAYHVTQTDRELVGYICGTLSTHEALTHQSMSEHIPSGSSVCIHSICVSETYRRCRVGQNLLKEYISRLEIARSTGKHYERILLITHDYLRPFYEQAGFELAGKSNVVHGSQPWYEMRRVLGPGPAALQAVPTGLWAALQNSSSGKNSTPRLYPSFFGGMLELTEPHTTKQGTMINKCDLLCPRSGCGSIVLKRGVGEWVERESVQMEPDGHPGETPLTPLPPPPEICQWWLVTPSPMQFENIGFSRPVHASDRKLRFLACAECDLGPLGWCEEGGNQFWLACSRVGYSV